MLNHEDNKKQIESMKVQLIQLEAKRRNCSFGEIKELDRRINSLRHNIKQMEVIIK